VKITDWPHPLLTHKLTQGKTASSLTPELCSTVHRISNSCAWTCSLSVFIHAINGLIHWDWRGKAAVLIPNSVKTSTVYWLEFNVPLQHKYGYIENERSRVESYPYPVKEGQQYINLNLATFLFSSHPKRERGIGAHLNYYTSAYNRGKQQLLHHRKTKLNQIQHKTRINLN